MSKYTYTVTESQEIKNIQKALQEKGLYVNDDGTPMNIDGVLGPKTQAILDTVVSRRGGTLGDYADIMQAIDLYESPTTPSTSTPTDVSNPTTSSTTSYSDYWDTQVNNAAEARTTSYAAAAKAREEAEARAEIARQRGVVDSNTLYQQQKATYGANAEQLGGMGLTVSGYSDYLNSQAYAAGMSYRQAANAQAAEANREARYTEQMAKLEADKIYNDRIAEIETARHNQIQAEKQQQQAMYASLMDGVMNGSIPAEQVATYAQALGITDQSMITNATNAATTYGENTLSDAQEAYYQKKIKEAEITGDIVTQIEYQAEYDTYGLSDDAKKMEMATNIASMIDSIIADDFQVKKLADHINNEVYGDRGATKIKEAYTESVKKTIDNEKNSNKKREIRQEAIESGLLTEEVLKEWRSLEEELSGKSEGMYERRMKLLENYINEKGIIISKDSKTVAGAVAQLQQMLIDAGYSISNVDGVFGDQTEAAVKAFQKDNNIETDGMVGSITWEALKKKEQ